MIRVDVKCSIGIGQDDYPIDTEVAVSSSDATATDIGAVVVAAQRAARDTATALLRELDG